MNEKDLMLTDLDYAIGDRRMQMLKAAIPYMEISQQRALSMFIKWRGKPWCGPWNFSLRTETE